MSTALSSYCVTGKAKADSGEDLAVVTATVRSKPRDIQALATLHNGRNQIAAPLAMARNMCFTKGQTYALVDVQKLQEVGHVASSALFNACHSTLSIAGNLAAPLGEKYPRCALNARALGTICRL